MRSGRFSVQEFREELQGGGLRTLQVIHLGLAGGVLVMVAMATLVLGVPDPAAPSVGVARTLTWVAMAAFVVALPLSQLLFAALLRSGLRHPMGAAPAGEEALGKIRLAYIVRSAMLEAPALLGVIAYVLAVRSGRLGEDPRYWITLLPAAVFLAMTALTFPTAGRLARLIEERFGS